METNPAVDPYSLTSELWRIARAADPRSITEQAEASQDSSPLSLERDNTFPIASAIEALDRAIGLVIEPRHLIELVERRAELEAFYEASIDAAIAAQGAIAWVASEMNGTPQARPGDGGSPPQGG